MREPTDNKAEALFSQFDFQVASDTMDREYQAARIAHPNPEGSGKPPALSTYEESVEIKDCDEALLVFQAIAIRASYLLKDGFPVTIYPVGCPHGPDLCPKCRAGIELLGLISGARAGGLL